MSLDDGLGVRPIYASPGLVAAGARGYRAGWVARLPYPVRNMLRRWRGMIGMVIGVGIALGIGMTMLAVSQATVEILASDFRLSAADLYVVTNGGTVVPLLPSDSTGTIEHARNLLAQIRGLPGVNTAVGVMTWSMERGHEGPRRYGEPTELIAATGVDGEPSEIPGALVLREGRWLRRSDEVVLGWKLSREKGLPVGSSLRLNGRDFTVVGIGKLRGFGFGTDSIAYLDYKALQQRTEVGDVLNIIAIDTSQPELTRERVQELASLSIFDPAQLRQKAEEVNASAMAIRGVFNVLTLTIAGLFVSNMLNRSVAQRRLEFATLRALGLPTRTILLTVAAEALLVCAAASLVGLVVSTAMGALINGYVAPSYGFESLYFADAGMFGTVFLLALALGLLAGFFPARRATRVDPVDVLREA